MQGLFKNIRFYVLVFSALLAISIFYQTISSITETIEAMLLVLQYYALFAVTYLYIALIATPLTNLFPRAPFAQPYLKARRAIGVSAFFFGLMHATLAFFVELSGLPGVLSLAGRELFAVSLGAVTLLILLLMASTAFDFMIVKIGYRKWKQLHRFVYLASITVLIHALLLGEHFANLSDRLPQALLAAAAILAFLELNRLDQYLSYKFPQLPRFGLAVSLLLIAVAGFIAYLYTPRDKAATTHIHDAHVQLAKDAQQDPLTTKFANIPGLNGDRTKRYTASFFAPDNVQPNQDVTLRFKIYDASSGNPISLFQRLYSMPMHLMVVDSPLVFFEHIHPVEQANGEFTITTQFPKSDIYHLYIQFQPTGGIEQQFGFVLPVGTNQTSPTASSIQPVDKEMTKQFDKYLVTLETPQTLDAHEMTLGNQKIIYTIKDAETKQPITTLKPYMAAFGHLTMINQQTYDFIHVHPFALTAPAPDASGGPTVEFLPIGIYGPFKPGIYRAFGEFSTQAGTKFDTNFTIEVEE